METLSATYRIVTPMFIGDGNQQATAIRPPSVKGALRFWWRALQWGKIRQNYETDEAALQELHKKEARLFGCAADERKPDSGQGVFLLRIIKQPNLAEWEEKWPLKPINNLSPGSTFLGFGLFESGKGDDYQPHRRGILETKNNKFTLRLDFKPTASKDDIASIEQALRVWGLFGGLGSRARRGFGAITLTELRHNNNTPLKVSHTQQQYEQTIAEHLTQFREITDYPPYTAFSGQASYKIFTLDKDARKVHNNIGTNYKRFRDEIGKANKLRKCAFGLPLKDHDDINRRASPLFFHVHELQDGTFIGIALFLPAVFHHKEEYTNTQRFLQPVVQFMEAKS